MNIDYELINLLFKNNLSHILDENDNKEYDICGKKINGELLTIHMKLATITNEEILEYLDSNILKSFKEFKNFLLEVNICNQYPHKYINSIKIMLNQKNYKFIEILVKHYNDKKPIIIQYIKYDHILFELALNNNYLKNEFKNEIINRMKNRHFLPSIDHIGLYLECADMKNDEKTLLELFISACSFNDLTYELIEKYPIIESSLIEFNKFISPTDPETYLIYKIINHCYFYYINVNSFKVFINWLHDKNFLYFNDSEGLALKLLNHIIYINKFGRYSDKIEESVKFIYNLILPKSPIFKNLEYICINYIYQGCNVYIVKSLFNFDIYKHIHNSHDVAGILIEAILIYNFKRIRNNSKYHVKDSYLHKKDSLLKYVDKYYNDSSILTKKSNIKKLNLKIDLITAAIIIGDIEVIRYLNSLKYKNFKLLSPYNNYYEEEECRCFYDKKNNDRIKFYKESDYSTNFNSKFNLDNSVCECHNNEVEYNFVLSDEQKKYNSASDIIQVLISDKIKSIKYLGGNEDNSKLVEYFKL